MSSLDMNSFSCALAAIQQPVLEPSSSSCFIDTISSVFSSLCLHAISCSNAVALSFSALSNLYSLKKISWSKYCLVVDNLSGIAERVTV